MAFPLDRWYSRAVDSDCAGSLDLATDDAVLIAKAERMADSFGRLSRLLSTHQLAEALRESLEKLSAACDGLFDRYTSMQLAARSKCAQWWRRRLRVAVSRNSETEAITSGRVHALAGKYVSRDALSRCRRQRARNRHLLESLVAINDLDQSFSLAELHDRSVSNPANRRAEWMARCYGFENYAERYGDRCLFLTLTTPSRMHARRSASGEVNPKYDATSPQVANQYLNNCWARTRAALHRRSIRPYGMRVAEPHHDATPHWHLLLFIRPDQADALISIFREYALREDRDEPGAQTNRFKWKAIDRAQGRPTAYIAKYISKNLDGEHIEADWDGTSGGESAQRAVTWASLWGIRQFQQIGGPPVGVWRELRRVDTASLSSTLHAAASAADEGDWCAYIEAMGGTRVERKHLPIRPAYAWSDKPNRYGEASGLRLVGLSCGKVVIPTRLRSWRVERKPLSVTGAEAQTSAQTGAHSGAHNSSQTGRQFGRQPEAQPDGQPGHLTGENAARPLLSWSSVNNCTGQGDRIAFGMVWPGSERGLFP